MGVRSGTARPGTRQRVLHSSRSHRTVPHRTDTEEDTVTFIPSPAAREGDLLREAFGDLHGRRLHGFAQLIALGDAPRAERAAAMALAAGEERATALRHPERAAAWLRARVLGAIRSRSFTSAVPTAERRATLAALGVEGAAYDGLAALSPKERAALVASMIEGFEPIDVEAILSESPASARRRIAHARSRYLSIAAGLLPADRGRAAGSLAQRVQNVAGRALSSVPDDPR